ncbi:MAG: UvrD-helicase domain-containing protein [Fimbriimonadaceae bacterium]|jgi:ATP-dependent exoDNAse (exonuclease V) beta subunit|nr:UvrD-helicase domain-containing protein [Fimbriimonadaceae bacterium]
MSKLTEEQLAVVHTQEPRLTIQAAAGSGKTLTLVQRYIKLVNDGVAQPDQILCITFTRKAAAVMKERIVRALNAQGTPLLAQIAETGPIQTIHGFCERVLRENALAAGVDPNFEVADTAQQTEFRTQATREALTQAPYQESPVMDYIRIRSGFRNYRQGANFEAGILDDVAKILEIWRGSGNDREVLNQMVEKPERLFAAWRTALCDELSPEQLFHLPNKEFQSDFLKLKSDLATNRIRLPKWLKSYKFEPDLERDASLTMSGLGRLAILAWEYLEDAMKQAQQFDFTLMEALAVDLLKCNPSVAQRVRDQFLAVLVDEAQDVNPVQDQLIKSIGAKSELFVGDPQQSIFGFRMADRQLFIDRGAETGLMQLSKNFRSEPGILAFIDHVFSQIWPDEYKAAAIPAQLTTSDSDDPFGAPESPFLGVEIWPPTGHWYQTAELVKQMVEEAGGVGDIAILLRTAKDFAPLQEELQKKGVPAVVVSATDRFYSRMETRDVANALTATVEPTNDFALFSFLHSPFVGLSTDAIVFLAAQHSAQEALNQIPDSLPEDQAKVRELLQWWPALADIGDRVPAWEILAALFRKTPYWENLARSPGGEARLANVRKLFVQSCGNPKMDALTFADHIRQIQSIRHKEGEALTHDREQEVVKLLTIHSAKGLEFDTVILPNSNEKLSWKPSPIEGDIKTGLFGCRLSENRKPLIWEYLVHRRREREVEESFRLLYVAMTRAKKKLCVAVAEAPGDSTNGEVLSRCLSFGPSEPRGIVFRGLKVDSEEQ